MFDPGEGGNYRLLRRGGEIIEAGEEMFVIEFPD